MKIKDFFKKYENENTFDCQVKNKHCFKLKNKKANIKNDINFLARIS